MKKLGALLVAPVFFIQFVAPGFAQDTKPFTPKLSLKLTGGIGSTAIGDMNTHLGSINQTFLPPDGNGLLYSTAKVNLFNNAAESWEIELRLDITTRVGIAFALANPLYLKETSSIQLFLASSGSSTPEGSFTCSPEIKARFPINANISYSLPVYRKMDLVFSAGTGFYSAKMKNSLDYEIASDVIGTGLYRNQWETAWKHTIGFHGGVGAEYAWSRHLAIVFDLQYRYVMFRSFQATMIVDTTAPMTGFDYDGQGTLYRWTWGEGGTLGPFFEEFFVWMGDPPSYSIERGGSGGKATLDMSGFSIRLGVKINLF